MKLKNKREWIVYAIIFQAFLGVIGSLYMSSYGDPIANLITGNIFPTDSGLLPCTLCWFGRILFYPILPIALIGFLKNDTQFIDYILPLSASGMALAAYHYGTQKFGWGAIEGCSEVVPCDQIQLEYLGFATIPFLAFFAFTLITALTIWYKNLSKEN